MKIVMAATPLRRYLFDDENRSFFDSIFLKRRKRKAEFNRRMFEEDFARIINYTNNRSRRLFDISSNDEALSERLLSNVETRYGFRSVDETVRELVREIAQSLVQSGTVYYCLEDGAKPGDIRIASFSQNGVARLFGRYIQWVPKRTERHWERDDELLPREIRILDSAKVMCFVMPKAIKRMLSSQSKTLSVIDAHQFRMTDFQVQATHDNPNPTNHFDFSIWRNMQERALYRSTRATGWNGRKYDSSKRSDFFDCYRLIRFRRNQIAIRDDILKQLGAELSRIGKVYNGEFSIKISGTDELPTAEHLNELEARLTREEASFTEIIDYCFKR